MGSVHKRTRVAEKSIISALVIVNGQDINLPQLLITLSNTSQKT